MKWDWFGLYLRGMAMGAADLVPGVSGGTIALITGIYDRLIDAISSVGWQAVKYLLSGEIKNAWIHIDGGFLLTVGAGILSAVVALASLLSWLMLHYPLPLWSLFCGLVLASSLYLFLDSRSAWSLRDYGFWVAGIGVALVIGIMQATQLPVSYGTVFLAGAIAISAMLLPGISGSFLLLLMGMYQPVIEAIVSADIATLAVFVAGCLVGLIGFSRLLKTLMRTAGRATMAVLYGFLLGSMITLWPWQRTVSSVVDRHGELRIVQSLPVSPAHYADTVGDPLLLLCAIAFISGLIAVWFLSSHARSGQ